MIGTLARKELLELTRDRRFRLAATATLGLLAVALATGVVHQRRTADERAQAQRIDRETWLGQGSKNPHSAAHFGMYAIKPPLPLAFADRGIDSYVGQTVWLEAHVQNLAQARAAEDRTAVQRFGELTAATVLQLLLPLLIVLLGFDAFTGERERGTLRQLASLGVPGRTLAIGKALGTAGALGVILAPATVLGAAALVVARPVTGVSDALARIAVMAASYGLYLAAFVGVTVMVSAVAGSSRAALVVLLGFWIANGLLGPRLMADIAARLHPTPAPGALWSSIREEMKGRDGHGSGDAHARAFEKRVLDRYKVQRLEDLPVSFIGLKMLEGEEQGNRVYDRHLGALRAIYERQERVHLLGAVAAPLLAVRQISMAMAGTDLAHHGAFLAQAEHHRRELQRLLNGDIAQNAKGREFSYEADATLWRRARAFAFAIPPFRETLGRQAMALALLGIWAALTALAAVRAAARVRVV